MKFLSSVFVFFLAAAVCCCGQSAPVPQTPDGSASAQQTAPAPEQQAPSSAAQTATTPPSTPQPPGSQTSQSADKVQPQSKDAAGAKKSTSGTSNDRLFFALPNFLTVDKNGNIIPLTSGQKFKVVARGAFDPVQIPWYGILSAIGQAENSEPGYGQGWGAYGKRWATYAADGTIENFFVGAILPSIFHQDPRFFPKPEGSFMSRAGYAVSRIVITRSDSGRKEFNVSEVLGSAISATISTYSYHPHPGYHPEPGVDVPYIPSDRTFDNTVSVWLSQMGYDAITITLKEFWPDIRRKFKKK